MSLVNVNTGLSLTTAGTGVIIPIQSNVLGGYIPASTLYTQISVCTPTNNQISLPPMPMLGATYTIDNNGVAPCFVSGGSTTSTINGVGSTNGASGQFLLASGGSCSFIAISNNGVASTSATTASANNPLVVWQSKEQFQSSVAPIVSIPTGTTTLALTNAQSGTIFMVPAMGGTCAVSLPPNAGNAGVVFTFRVTATVAHAMTFTAGTANTIVGLLNLYVSGVTSAITLKNTASTCVITATALVGDTMSLTGDGTFWWLTGLGSAAASFS